MIQIHILFSSIQRSEPSQEDNISIYFMLVPVRLLICYLQTQGEAENERKIEVNQLMTTRDDFLWSLSHSGTNLEGKKSFDQSDA